MLLDKPYVNALGARLEDFFASVTPWTRQLWRLSTLGEARELLEAWDLHRQGALSDTAVKYLADGLVRRIKADVGIGSVKERGIFLHHAQRKLLPKSYDAAAFAEMIEHHTPYYLNNWASAAAQSEPSIETLSRAICSHLLDSGFSRTALSRWLHHHKRRNNIDVYDAADLIALAGHLLDRKLVRYEMIIPLEAAPELAAGTTSCWLNPTETSQWLEDWFPDRVIETSGRIESDHRFS